MNHNYQEDTLTITFDESWTKLVPIFCGHCCHTYEARYSGGWVLGICPHCAKSQVYKSKITNKLVTVYYRGNTNDGFTSSSWEKKDLESKLPGGSHQWRRS